MKQILILASLAFLFSVSKAQTVTIYRSGLPISPTYSTLKAALPNTINGDEVRLSAHTFNEYNDTVRTKIKIIGTISGTDTTTIDGKGLGGVLFVIASSTSITDTTILEDMIITGGNNPAISGGTFTGGGIACGAQLALKGNIIVRNNRSGASGAGISVNGTLILMGGEGPGSSVIKIYGNINDYAIGRGGGIYTFQSNLFMYGNVQINNNTAYTGAGLFSYRAQFNKIVIDSKGGTIEIKNNNAGEIGGGIYFASPPFLPGNIGPGISLKGNIIISGNTAKAKGGGIGNSDSTRLIGPGIQITNNHADGGGGGVYGYIKSQGGYTIMDNVLISGNTTTLKGGGVYVDYNHNMQISNSQIINNQASGVNAAHALHNENITSLVNNRIYNPKPSGGRQLEVLNNNKMTSSQCWWGESDTTGLVFFNNASLGSYYTLTNWVKANWSVNNGSPVGTASTYPIAATFTLNTGAALLPSSFQMLQGKYTAGSGSFSPAIANMTAANKISSTYTRPGSGLSTLWAIVDADSFKSNSNGLSVEALSTTNNTLKLYPNPTNGILTVEGITQKTNARLLGLQANVLTEWTLTPYKTTVDMTPFATGIYILQIQNAAGQYEHYKLMKE